MIEPRSIETERVVAALRWLSLTVILVLAHFVPAAQVDLPLVYRLILAGAIYNLLYMGLLRLRFLPSFLSDLTILAELCFIAAMVYATGGVGSPLLAFSLLPVITAAFRLGLYQSLAVAALSSLLYFSFLFFNRAGRMELEHVSRVGFTMVYFFTAAILGYILGSHGRRSAERGLLQEKQAAQESSLKLQALSAQAQAIAEVSGILSSTLNYERVLETILSEFRKLLGFDVGIVFLFDRQGGELRVATERGLTPPDRLVRLQPGEGVVGQVIRRGDPLLIANPTKDGDLQHFVALAEARSALCVPLHAG